MNLRLYEFELLGFVIVKPPHYKIHMGRKEAYRKGTFLKVFHGYNDLDCFEAEEKTVQKKERHWSMYCPTFCVYLTFFNEVLGQTNSTSPLGDFPSQVDSA